MLKYFLFILLIPACTQAQEITPVISPDYLKLIAADSTGNYKKSNFDSAKGLYALLKQEYNTNYKVKDVKRVNNKVLVLPVIAKYVCISGTYSLNTGYKLATALPHL